MNHPSLSNPSQAVKAFGHHPASLADDTCSVSSRHTLHTLNPKHSDSSISVDMHSSPETDSWSALHPSHSPSSAAPPSIPTPISAAERRNLLIRAGVQLLILFIVCCIGLGGTLWLALPVIDLEDRPFFRIPHSFQQLKELNAVLQHYKSENFSQVMLCWIVIYMFLQAFSIPGSMYMSILAGALWGVPIALPLVCVSVATGATICFLISKFLGVVLLALPSWKARVDSWKDKLSLHEDNLLSYMILIRMMPLPPHNLVNIISPHLGVSIPTFWLSTFFGIFAVSLIHTTIGEKLDQMTSADDFHLFSWRNILLLVGVAIAVLIPVAVRRFSKVEPLEEQPDHTSHGPLFLSDDNPTPSTLHRVRSLIGRSRNVSDLFQNHDQDDNDNDNDDELPSAIRVLRCNRQRLFQEQNLDDNVTEWDGAVHGSHIGEEGFHSDDESPMFTDRNNQDASTSRASVTDKLKSWFSNKTQT